ncbi:MULTISPECIES: peptidoglycan editing factor PgeF [unclassified Caballeronia]|uniref:peptidoglycan editing factor PgeF n=1 Tax=unclassified Caballeronia TaxID=2646786 RepID=UPI00285637BB|nr:MULTISPECIES: peptidoglycan editing factor PgeF [unclassified Caballeronia]MDR5738264.1 peptidoglycan editing factor PgeF [Caballeronia sp. LZ016]MDR5811880.1 peptidoglycan editing factor PgeF [Caballeronia sp. LZ019]
MSESSTGSRTADAPPLEARHCLWPQWRVSPRVRAFVTTRAGGVSVAPYHGGAPDAGGLNLGLSTGDAPDAVRENRRRALALTGARDAAWLQQVHGTQVEDAHAVIDAGAPVDADASVTDRAGIVCVVMTADCLPVLFCDDDGRAVGAAHAGWRGLAGGIVEKTGERVAALAGASASRLNAYLGPAIGPNAFEVGEDVLQAFAAACSADRRDATVAAFRSTGSGNKYLADIYALARLRLAGIGIDAARIHGGAHCTVTETERFYSYRRDRVTGRMAAMIWLAD